jgi:hypothetical protein
LLRTSLVFLTGIVAAVICASSAAAAGPSGGGPAALQPVPSLTPAATQRLWRELVRRPRVQSLRSADCRPLRAVFYSPTDWLRLTTRLAATPSPCAEYYVSVPPLAADKTQLRANQASQIRALGPAFHALAEINVTGWTSWVATTGNSWYAAGVEARGRMAAAGYDVAAGDTWALNELSSAVRQGTGNARANMRAFLRGLYDGDGVLPAARGAVFVVGIAQTTGDLSVYQARLQDWYEDADFWSDVSRYASDWSQELYGDIRTYAVAGIPREARRDSLNEYLQHAATLVGVAPAGTEAAQAFLAGAYSPLANAAWQYDAAFGWTNVPVELMQDYVSAQTYATRSAGNSRFGFAWSPRNLSGIPTQEFNAQTDALLVRLAAAIADSSESPEGACSATWCVGNLDGAVATTAWRTFGAWKPSVLAFTTAPQTLSPGLPSAPVTVELRTSAGTPYNAGLPVPVELRSSSPTAEFSLGQGGPWTTTLTTSIASGQGATSFFVRDTTAGTADIVAGSPGKTGATQALTVADTTQPDTTPPETTIDSAPTGTITSRDAAITFSASEPGAHFECALDGAPFAACTSPASYAELGDGAHAFDVRAIDAASNADASPARASWVVAPPSAPVSPAPAPPVSGGGGGTAPVVPPVIAPPPTDPVTVLAQPRVPVAAPALRALTAAPVAVARSGRMATFSIRFWVDERARLRAMVTPLRSTRPLALRRGTILAGTRLAAAQSAVTTTVARGGAYVLQARLGTTGLVRGRSYLVRLTAVASDGRTRTLTVRVRA